jgi:hypothetical protein
MPSKKGPISRHQHSQARSIRIVGAGVRPRVVQGFADDLGYADGENERTGHDLQAQALHQLRIDHEFSSFRSQGRDTRLVGVEKAGTLTNVQV